MRKLDAKTTHSDACRAFSGSGGEGVYFDPLYGGSFAERAEDYCMAPAALLKETHQWDENALR